MRDASERGIGWVLQTHGSTMVEQVLEYQLLAALTPELLRRGLSFEVLRGDTDCNGHDIVIEAGGVMRHVQLKGTVAGGKTRKVPINIGLGAKPSGCVVWMNYDPRQLAITGLRWFGGRPGERLPDLGDKPGRHTRPNKNQEKAIRPNIRELPIGRFTRLPDVAALTDHLFGPVPLGELHRHLGERDLDPGLDGWLAAVRAGDFAQIPDDLDWDQSGVLAQLIDGYVLTEALGLGDAMEYEGRQLTAATETGVWPGNATELWITLFLEHRRWRFSTPFEPEGEQLRLLDALVRQLRDCLLAETNR